MASVTMDLEEYEALKKRMDKLRDELAHAKTQLEQKFERDWVEFIKKATATLPEMSDPSNFSSYCNIPDLQWSRVRYTTSMTDSYREIRFRLKE